jgi:uncharacterized protein (TIGR02598 family)
MSTTRKSPAAFSLIEVTLALGIAAFCLLTVFGLLPIGLNSTQNASEQTAVSGIATAISADFHGVALLSSTGASTSQFQFQIPAPGQNQSSVPHTLYFSQDGSPAGTVDQNATDGIYNSSPRYRATVTVTPDPTLQKVTQNTEPRTATMLYKVWILVTWPALADPKPADNNGYPSNFAGSFETFTAVNYYKN